MAAINNAGLVSKTYPVRDTLFFKLQGTPAAIKETADAVKKITRRHGSSQFEFAQTEQEASELWENRKYALTSTITSGGEGARVWTTDVWCVSLDRLDVMQGLWACGDSVPVSRLPELVYETKKDLAEAGLRSTIVGHVGDGNFHALLIFHSNEELQKVSEAVHRLVHRAIALDGTCKQFSRQAPFRHYTQFLGTGEHGVGVGKKEYLIEELGEDTVELMRTVKKAIDPLDIMNPSKVSVISTPCYLMY